MGTSAVADSLLACTLPASDRAECIRMLLSNANSMYEGARNRQVISLQQEIFQKI